MSNKNEKTVIEDIFRTTLEEAKKKPFFAKKDEDDDDDDSYEKDRDHTDDNNDDDGKESGSKEEKDEDKKVKQLKKFGKKEKKEVKEETLAASSLHPAARSISDDKALSKSKIGMMQHVLGSMNGMSKGDLTDWFTKTMAQFGPGKTYGVGDNSGKNTSSIDMHSSDAVSGKGPKTKEGMPTLDDKGNPLKSGKGMKFSVKEDVEEMFAGQELSEEFKENVTTIFEAAISARIVLETARLEEEYEEALTEELTNFQEEVTTKLDTYLDYVVENWMKENEIAVESTLRNELMDEFVEGLKGLFSEHYISVPQEKVDVLELLADKVKELETRLDETITENVELKQNLSESIADDVFNELASDLALTQQEKFKALAEGIEFDGNINNYTKKLKLVKENYFKQDTTVHVSNINEETFEGDTSTNVTIDPQVNRYIKALDRTVKN